MQGVWDDIFSHSDHQEEALTTAAQVEKEDVMLSTDPMTPINIGDCPQSMQFFFFLFFHRRAFDRDLT